jgi:hypothetical protein
MTMTARKVDARSISDSLYHELLGTKSKLNNFISTIEHTEGNTRKKLTPHLRHLHEMKDYIEWKMEILSKVYPVDWKKYDADFESTASVKIEEENDFTPGGYVGG